MKRFKVDIFLSAHASQFEMEEKLKRLRSEANVNPFIDPKGYLDYVNTTERAFRDRLASQSAKP